MPRIIAEPPGRPRWPAYAISFAVCLAAAAIGSRLTTPHLAGWYAGLAKPIFNPPNWVFPVVWPILYLTMAIAAARIAAGPDGPARRAALVFFAAQLALNVLWSFAFIGRESPAAGMLTIVILIAAIAATTILFWRLDRPAGIMMLPYLAWVSFAAVLNGSIVAMN